MSTSCIRPEDFGDIGALPADDPVRLHLVECARCQARWKAYRSFLEDAESPSRSRAELEAEARLGEMVRVEFGLSEAKVTARRRLRPEAWPGWLPSRPRTRLLILAPSAILVAFAILVLSTDHRPGSRETVFRGSESNTSLRLESTQVLPDGRIRLAWSAVAGAEAYRVRILDPALNTVFETNVPTGTSTVLRPSDIGDAARPGSELVWRVTALRDGEEIGISGAGTLRIR